MNIFYHIILIGRKYWFYLIVGLLAMLAAGLVTVLPSYALKIIVDILAGGQILKQKVISLNLIPNQLVHYGLKTLSIEVKALQDLDNSDQIVTISTTWKLKAMVELIQCIHLTELNKLTI